MKMNKENRKVSICCQSYARWNSIMGEYFCQKCGKCCGIEFLSNPMNNQNPKSKDLDTNEFKCTCGEPPISTRICHHIGNPCHVKDESYTCSSPIESSKCGDYKCTKNHNHLGVHWEEEISTEEQGVMYSVCCVKHRLKVCGECGTNMCSNYDICVNPLTDGYNQALDDILSSLGEK